MIPIETIKHKIQLDFKDADIQKTVIKQNSHASHKLLISLYDGGNIFPVNPDWTITISGKKEDGTSIINQSPISVTDNIIEITLTQQMLAAPGTEKCELLFQEDETVLYSNTFLLYIEPNVQDGTHIESINECDVLTNTLAKMTEYRKQAENVKDSIDEMAVEIANKRDNLDDGLIKSSEKGQVNGVAGLDETGTVPKAQLPDMGEAVSAARLQNTEIIGHSTRPVYFNAEGVPVPIDYVLKSACTRSAVNTVSSGSPEIPTSGAIYTALSKKASYEEGTWTPGLITGGALLDKAGWYARIGNLCFLQGAIKTPAITGTFVISGVPFIPASDDDKFMPPFIWSMANPYDYSGDGRYSGLGKYKSSNPVKHNSSSKSSIEGGIVWTGTFLTFDPANTPYGETSNADFSVPANTYVEFNVLYRININY